MTSAHSFVRKNVPWATMLDGSVRSRNEAMIEIITDAAKATLSGIKKDIIGEVRFRLFRKEDERNHKDV